MRASAVIFKNKFVASFYAQQLAYLMGNRDLALTRECGFLLHLKFPLPDYISPYYIRALL